jgi:hypothetical protein
MSGLVERMRECADEALRAIQGEFDPIDACERTEWATRLAIAKDCLREIIKAGSQPDPGMPPAQVKCRKCGAWTHLSIVSDGLCPLCHDAYPTN